MTAVAFAHTVVICVLIPVTTVRVVQSFVIYFIVFCKSALDSKELSGQMRSPCQRFLVAGCGMDGVRVQTCKQ